MSNKIGRFDILSEIYHSDRITVFKASDPERENPKTIALKALRLEPFGEQAPLLVDNLLQEAKAGKTLNSHNVGLIYGAGEIDGLFCAQLEYVEGNSIATMLLRKEGFSIWDVMDIARQTCQGLDHAHANNLAHYTLEPAKIMVAWDGTVKVLGFGASTMSAWAAQASGAPPEVLYYMSPEQLAGDALDARSNVFSVGVMLYEMVTERRPFTGEGAADLRQAIHEMSPVAPDQVNCKIHPVLSHVIMKALAKNPEERFASGAELVKELDRCRESSTKAAAKIAPTQKRAASGTVAGIVQPEKFGRGADPAASTPAPKPDKAPPAKSAPAATHSAVEAAPQVHRATKAAAASSAGGSSVSDQITAEQSPGSQASVMHSEPEQMSAFVAEEPTVRSPKIPIDPLMAEGPQAGAAKRLSFSEIDELPPLKEVIIAPPPLPVPDEIIQQMISRKTVEPEKPKIQVRAVAKRAVEEVQKTPPRLFFYSISAALVAILTIVAAMTYHFHLQTAADENPPAVSAVPSVNNPAANAATTQAASESSAQTTPAPEAKETVTVSEKPKSIAKKKAKAAASVPVAPAVVLGQLNITSTPAGAQIQVDGQSNPAWVTPFDMSALQPGQHTVSISKPGFQSDSRSIEVTAGSKSFLSVQLAPLTATVTINSDPAGAEVWMDGKDTGKTSPAQFAVDKAGSHTFSFKKQGYLDETVSANLQTGQVSHLAPTLRALGNTDDIRMGGKLKKLLGGGETAGMGSIAIKTQPKGAQVAVNNRVLDKASPVDFSLNPGNYVVDITLSGFKSIHRVVSIDKGGKIVIDEALERE